jgi:hypothetical protein
MTMREMRLLIAETSSMNGIYNVGENIVLEHDYVGILLEGILKTKDQNMRASPGVLLPPNIHSNFGQNSSGKVHFHRWRTFHRNLNSLNLGLLGTSYMIDDLLSYLQP